MTEKRNAKRPSRVHIVFHAFCLMLLLTFFTNCSGGGGGQAAFNPGESSAKDITAFSILGVNGTIIGSSITLTVPYGTSRDSLVATFTSTGVSVIVDAVEQTSGVTANDFSDPVTYTVTAQDDSTKNYTVTVSVASAPTGAIVADHTHTGKIPADAVNLAKARWHIAYGHTSHGSQLVTGMNALAAAESLYSGLDLVDSPFSASDLGSPDRTSWAASTRSYLGAVDGSGRGSNHPEINVIVWSWCGQVSGATETDINTYLNLMNELEEEYPGIHFVYMTGHLDGTGTTGNLHLRNQQIRNYCSANGKILFDFADIESYDPSGFQYLDRLATDGCNYDYNNSGSTTQTGDPATPINGDHNWAMDWIAANPFNELTTLANDCDSCAHSQRLNCVLKGRAVWWLWARLAGWDGNP